MKVIVNDILLNHIESGHPHGLPIVFVHGFPFNNSMWEPQFKGLPTHFRLIAYDIRGFGKSDIGNGESSIATHAEDLVGLLDDLEIDKAIICGLSMGGYIALKAIEKYPERFKGLVLCDTKSEADTTEARQKRFDTIAQIEKNGVMDFASEFLEKVLTKNTFSSNKHFVKELENKILENPNSGIIAALKAMANRSDTTSVLKKIKIPTLIMVGELDEITPKNVAKDLKEQIAGAELVIIPNAGHLSNLENSSFFNEKLVDFLSGFPTSLPG